jgi:two-component system, OmpR family, sensor histidine kinase KdpD
VTQVGSSPDTGTAGDARDGQRRGRLKVYLGAAPGSGKTFAMLREARERRTHGEDVVVGFVETHGRKRTQEAIGTLEVVPRVRIPYKSVILEEMDLDAVLERRPQVALVDELAHTNVAGVKNPKRWQDIEDLRDAGIDVITTVNVQHLESVTDLVEHITGITVRETVPDRVLDAADEIQFIDISPEALRKRMQHGNVYGKDRVEGALSNFFRPGNLAALREIALRLVAQRIAREQAGSVLVPQDVIVGVSGRASSAVLIRRAVRIARRYGGACTVVHVADPRGQTEWRQLATELDCNVRIVPGGKIADAIITAAHELGARHVVLGEPVVPGLFGRVRRTVVDRAMDELPDVDLHVVARWSPQRPERPAYERPSPEALLEALSAPLRRRGRLRIYLGYARGCGTTTAMLDEAKRSHDRGADVVIAGLAPGCPPAPGGVPVLRPTDLRQPADRLDLAALLARNPDRIVVDDLAGMTTDGRTIASALPAILDSGITVIATVHLADLRSTVDTIGHLIDRPAGRPVLDDSVVDAADELELVDITPDDLRERIREGEVLPRTSAASALQAEFRTDLLAVMREMALRRIAEHTDRRLMEYMRTRKITAPWEARPRILACVPPRPGAEHIIRRAASAAGRRGEPFTAATVRPTHRTDDERSTVGGYATLTHQLGGEFVTLDGRDPPTVLAEFARTSLATEVVAARGPRRSHRTLRRLIRLTIDVDVVILSRVPPGQA